MEGGDGADLGCFSPPPCPSRESLLWHLGTHSCLGAPEALVLQVAGAGTGVHRTAGLDRHPACPSLVLPPPATH